MLYRSAVWAFAAVAVDAVVVERQAASSPSGVPDYFVTVPELFPGPTPTGAAGFLAQTNPAPFIGTTYIPNSPLETQVPIVGNTNNGNIFELHGQLSHYFPNPSGFGVDEYSLPTNASIVQLHMLSRHGSRYPTSGAGAEVIGQKITNFTKAGGRFGGDLSFLNTWSYKLGAEILVPVGKQELFDSGTLHQIQYGHLYKNNGSKIVARTTSQDRMLQSAEYFMAGFFGLMWPKNATLVVSYEVDGATYNNSLAGYGNCPNSNTAVNQAGNNASRVWENIYLVDAQKRLNAISGSFNWTIGDVYNAQSLCAYEEVALGYSAFCKLFTYSEWEGYEYSIDLAFAGNNMFQSPTGRAIGIGYVQELYARLQHQLITKPAGQVNLTLDNNTTTFPLNQSLYFDFSHDTNIAAVLTAFGLKQFATLLPSTYILRNRSNIVSHMECFGSRLDVEIIETPQPLSGNRRGNNGIYTAGNTTRYVHFILNQRTIPLGVSFPECGNRDDGWCELTTFTTVLSTKLAESQFDYACFGKYPAQPYGAIYNGAPLPSGSIGTSVTFTSTGTTSPSPSSKNSGVAGVVTTTVTVTAAAPVCTPSSSPKAAATTSAKVATTTGRTVTQIGDGQIQAPPAPTGGRTVTQIGDGQVQAPAGGRPVTQIGDGQIQAPVGGRPVTQIGDGQIQAPKTAATTFVQATTTTGRPVTQIGDGQIQAPVGGRPVTQIGDGQVQAPKPTAY